MALSTSTMALSIEPHYSNDSDSDYSYYYNYPVYPDKDKYIINAETYRIFYQVTKSLVRFLSVLGVVNNVMTIIIFAKMGFKESTNITMTAIAFWDLIKCLVVLYLQFRHQMLRYTGDYAYYTGLAIGEIFEKIHNVAIHTSGMLAVYVALERCLCVSMPFTVRFLLTRKTASVMSFAVSFIFFALFSIYFCYGLPMVKRLDPPIPGLSAIFNYFTPSIFDNSENDFDRYLSILNMICPIATLCITSVCTGIILYHLKRASKFRSQNKKDGSKQMSTRDRKTTMMLVVILIFYIVYLVPWISFYGIYKLIETYHYITLYAFVDLDLTFSQLVRFSSLISSSVNIYIFYFMSSEFKLTVKKMFHLHNICK